MSLIHRLLLASFVVTAVACDEELPEPSTATAAKSTADDLADDSDSDTDAGTDADTDTGVTTGEDDSDSDDGDSLDPSVGTLSPKLANCRAGDGDDLYRMPDCDP